MVLSFLECDTIQVSSLQKVLAMASRMVLRTGRVLNLKGCKNTPAFAGIADMEAKSRTLVINKWHYVRICIADLIKELVRHRKAAW